MLTPEYLQEIIEATQEKVADVNNYLVSKIVKRILDLYMQEGKIEIIPSSLLDIKKQEYAGELLKDIQSEIEKQLPDIKREVKKAFYDAGAKIANDTNATTAAILKAEHDKGNLLDVAMPEMIEIIAATKESDLQMTKSEVARLKSAFERTNGEIYNLTKTAPNTAQQTYINACDEVYFKVMHGVSPNTAIVEAIKEVSKKGVTTVHYKSGREEKIEVAIPRAVRTGVNQANGDITLTRAAESGVHYVLVSQHAGARVTSYDNFTNHSLWQGQVYSLDWNNEKMSKYVVIEKEEPVGKFAFLKKLKKFFQDQKNKKYKDFIETCGYGQMLGICGINCRHSFGLFYPGISINNNKPIAPAENKKRYELEQKQRAMERVIRQTKSEISTLEAANGVDITNDWEKAHYRLLKQDKAYHDFCKSNNLKPLKWRLQNAKINGVENISNNAGGTSGALNNVNDPLGKKREAHAIKYYDEVRNRKPEYVIDKISKNSNVSLKAAENVYNHVFTENHIFKNGDYKMFYPEYNMAESFRRILEGKNIQPHDIVLIKHENLELNLMRKYNMVYEDAHNLTVRKYDYDAALKEFLRKVGD